MRLTRLSMIITQLTAPGSRTPTHAEDTAEINQLKEQIEQLDQKPTNLEQKRELEQESAAEKTQTTSRVSVSPSGVQVRSADSDFVLRVRGYVQADARFYLDDSEGGNANGTFLIRRARSVLEGRVYEKFNHRIMLHFGSGVTSGTGNNGYPQDADVTARFWPELQIQAGRFKEPVGLERLQSGADLLLIERACPTPLVPNRDVGVQVQGDLSEAVVSYAETSGQLPRTRLGRLWAGSARPATRGGRQGVPTVRQSGHIGPQGRFPGHGFELAFEPKREI